jgi:hypothetical protein
MMVVPPAYYAVSDESGQFEFTGVPRGLENCGKKSKSTMF